MSESGRNIEQLSTSRLISKQPASDHPEANASGVTWSAVIAGAVVTAALYLILLTLGADWASHQFPSGQTQELPPQRLAQLQSSGSS
jgi:hypothetical protein